MAAQLATKAMSFGAHSLNVATSFVGLVAKGANVSIPSAAQIAEANAGFGNMFAYAQKGAWKNLTVKQAGQVAAGGFTVYGFFLVGEMVGRASLVGYKVPGAHAAGGHH
ncbi:hypothetical protein HDU98_009847 [Podochytrium sp. JEL0797]|nr:hypothetical protein HDU98_009847 [Podochytrium sp. JEL0797]